MSDATTTPPHLVLPVLRRNRISFTSTVWALAALTILFQWIPDYIRLGTIPAMASFMNQIGIKGWTGLANIGVTFWLLYLLIQGLWPFLRRKVWEQGNITFQTDRIQIAHWLVYEQLLWSELPRIHFHLGPIPPNNKPPFHRRKGSWLEIPSSNGLFKTEIYVKDELTKRSLLEELERVKTQYNVEVRLEERKR